MAGCSKILLPRNILKIVLVLSLPEAGKSVLPLKRSLTERLGKKMEILENADKAPKRGTATAQTSGADAVRVFSWSFLLTVLFVRWLRAQGTFESQ